MSKITEFDGFEARINAVRDEVVIHAAALLRIELVAIHETFPGYQFEFFSGVHSPYVRVSPPLYDAVEINAYDTVAVSRGTLAKFAKLPEVQVLGGHLRRMSDIVVILEDEYKRSVPMLTMEAGPDLDAVAEAVEATVPRPR